MTSPGRPRDGDWALDALEAPGGGLQLQWPPGASKGPPWASRAPQGPQGFWGFFLSMFGLARRFGSGFRFFWAAAPYPPLADPGIQRFQANLLGWSGRVPSGAPGRTSTRLLGLGFFKNLKESRKGRSPRQGHCPSTWRCSSRST